ncbi:MAG: hypothetical protein NTV51_18435 [Verrucomicrobia bacterium]|nr:hypothetical protein [Verrucomicrobiota bacterium]
MKSNSLVSILYLVLLVTVARAQVYQPPGLSSIDPVFRTGAQFNQFVAYNRGSLSAPPQIILHYGGTASFARSAFSTANSGSLQIPIPAPLAGSYRLDRIELADATGSTIYLRDGTISRVLYSAPSLPTTHSVNLAAGDFSTGGAPLPSPETGRAINLSTRGQVGAGDQVLIVGLTVSSGTKSFLFRAIGPALGDFGVTGFVRDPKIELKNQAGAVLAQNDNWTPDLAAPTQSVGGFALPAGSRDAALRATLPAGNYSLVISGVDGSTGVALAEAYELP